MVCVGGVVGGVGGVGVVGGEGRGVCGEGGRMEKRRGVCIEHVPVRPSKTSRVRGMFNHSFQLATS